MDDEWVDITPTKGPLLPAYLDELPVRKKETRIDPKPLYQRMAKRAVDVLNSRPAAPIFHVNMKNSTIKMNAIFEYAFPPEHRSEVRCNTCAHFINRYGDLCIVDDSTGKLIPLFWSEDKSLPVLFRAPVSAMCKLFEDGTVAKEYRITSNKSRSLGFKKKGGFRHMAFEIPCARRVIPLAVARTMSPTNEQREMLQRILEDYNTETVRKAAAMLQENRLPYADAHKGAIGWLLDVQKSRGVLLKSSAVSDTKRHNIQTHIAASAFIGCLKQLRSGALSKLLEGVKEGKEFKELDRQWRELCDPKIYLRPQKPPKAGNIAVAEKLFEELGLTKGDMSRKYLAPSDIPKEVYTFRDLQVEKKTSKQDPKKQEGIFTDVIPRSVPKFNPKTQREPGELDPPKSISFSNFVHTILPTAKEVEVKLQQREYLYFLISGYPGSKPLMQWHTKVNLVSPFTFTSPVSTSRYNLYTGWNRVTAVVPFPHLWDAAPAAKTFPLLPADASEFQHYHRKHGFRYLVCLDGIEEKTKKVGLCLFPAMLKSQFHSVRATIEAYSAAGTIEEPAGNYVGGISVSRSNNEHTRRLYRVTDEDGDRKLYETVIFE
ncbi:hypothetical protein I7I51_09110 [Histoplasma capsulatum]|uniref:Uncharacterized protein n=1 Tax=Ajellomyces capsulatus TaxID=5037 RepID=A0A8A1M4V3_AJECA|nr:predicted protein [Histoplasma mississippiense (nom. inval.)]EDN06723.1 predicted protein [Histoplasma mississippiense (nom. inval.)]QSS59674.1 hypothetical protein I7I51_09110 [Histoplasma capsulatum]